MRTRIDSCYQCPDRYPGCHGSCEKYIQQKKELEESKAETRKQAEIRKGLNHQLYSTIHRVTKRSVYQSKYK